MAPHRLYVSPPRAVFVYARSKSQGLQPCSGNAFPEWRCAFKVTVHMAGVLWNRRCAVRADRATITGKSPSAGYLLPRGRGYSGGQAPILALCAALGAI